jgi:hypothetical protein
VRPFHPQKHYQIPGSRDEKVASMVFEELILGKSLTKYRIAAGGMAS